MRRIVITGANGAGKSHFARELGRRRPDLPVVCYDALRLTENWIKRPTADIHKALRDIITEDAWVLEGGPSLLRTTLMRAQILVWIDPPLPLRAGRLVLRPWQHLGRTRPELPYGNVDWPLEQYRFAWRSLRRDRAFKAAIRHAVDHNPHIAVRHCRSRRDVSRVLSDLASTKS